MAPFKHRLRRDIRGIAAVEFALISPVLMLMFFGSIELANGMQCRGAVKAMASAAADLVSQAEKITNDDKNNIFASTSAILYPFPASSIKIVMTSIVEDGQGGTKVAWSDALNTAARTVNATITVPSGLIPAGGSVILAEVTYTYESPIGFTVTSPITMTSLAYSLPRLKDKILRVQ